MTLAVLMPAYNASRYLAQALDSALGQKTDFPVEIVVGNDGSTDDTAAILQRYAERNPGRLRVVTHERNVGYARNLAELITSCGSEYVALLDSDDYWTDDQKLQRQVDFLKAHQNHAACSHFVTVLDENGGAYRYPPIRARDLHRGDFVTGNHVATSSVVYRNSYRNKFPTWLLEHRELDWLLHLLQLEAGPMRLLPEVFGVYRVHTGGLWSNTCAREKLSRIDAVLSAIRSQLSLTEPERRHVDFTQRDLQYAMRLHLHGLLNLTTNSAWGKIINYLLLTRHNRRLLPYPMRSLLRFLLLRSI